MASASRLEDASFSEEPAALSLSTGPKGEDSARHGSGRCVFWKECNGSCGLVDEIVTYYFISWLKHNYLSLTETIPPRRTHTVGVAAPFAEVTALESAGAVAALERAVLALDGGEDALHGAVVARVAAVARPSRMKEGPVSTEAAAVPARRRAGCGMFWK